MASKSSLTILFENPFWIGLYERIDGDKYEVCKATLLMALLRGVNIPCRIHGFEVSKDFQHGATTGIIAALAPDKIVHTWAEVYYKGQWLAALV